MRSKSFIEKIIRNPIVQTFVIYISGGWIVLELTDYIINKYSLNEQISDVLPLILLIGLPVAILLAWYLSNVQEKEIEIATESASGRNSFMFLKTIRKKPWFYIPGAVVLIFLLISGIRYLQKKTKTRWANEVALPEIEYFFNEMNISAAFTLVQKAEKYISNDPKFKELSSWVSKKVTILTNPPGAKIFLKDNSDIDGEWRFLGNNNLSP